jgi:hypothetical protein
VLGLEHLTDELRPARRVDVRLVLRLELRLAVVERVAVDHAQLVRELAQLRRKRVVGGRRVGPDGVAADLGDDDAVEERDVGVPLVGRAALVRVDLLEQGPPFGRGDRGMAEREAAEGDFGTRGPYPINSIEFIDYAIGGAP